MSVPQAIAYHFRNEVIIPTCSKTADGQGINNWEHPTLPKPTQTEVDTYVAEYQTYVSSGGEADDVKTAIFNRAEIKAISLTIKDFFNEVMAGRTTPITNNELKTKFKGYTTGL